MKTTMLRKAEYYTLIEALRRRSRFLGDPSGGPSIIEQWTGLGSATTYKQAAQAGYMACATQLNPGCDTWWKLTEKGARIVCYWIGQGYDHARIEKGELPSMGIPPDVL